MKHGEQRGSDVANATSPLVRRIIAITSKRRHLSETDERTLLGLVERHLNRPENYGLGRFRGLSSLATYLVVVVQKLYLLLMKGRPVKTLPTERSPLAEAIQHTSSSLPSREALVLKMWFESGLTTQKIATVLDMVPSDVHTVIDQRKGRVQDWLERSSESPPATNEAEETL